MRKTPPSITFPLAQFGSKIMFAGLCLGPPRMGKKGGGSGFPRHFFVSRLPATHKPLDFFPDQSLSS